MGNALRTQNNVVNKAGTELSYRQMQQLIQDIPVMFKGIYQQMESLRKLTERQTNTQNIGIDALVTASEKQSVWLTNIHDRFDALLVETRVSNMLMSEFLELQKVVIKEDIEELATERRAALYDLARNGG